METIYTNSAATLIFDPQKKQLLQKWKGFSDSESFKEIIDKSVEFVSKGGVQFIISDTLDQGVVKPADTQYAVGKAGKLFQSGVKKMAFVIPKSALTQLSLNSFKSGTGKPANIEYFATISDAEKWLS